MAWNRSSPPILCCVQRKAPRLRRKPMRCSGSCTRWPTSMGNRPSSTRRSQGLRSCSTCRRGVKQGIDRLTEWGLVERVGTTFLLKEPTTEALALWETRPVQPTTPFKPVRLKLPDDTTAPDFENRKANVQTINERIDHHSRMMLKAECPEKDIHEYWRYVIRNTLTDEQLWEYAVCDFKSVFKDHSKEHHQKRVQGPSDETAVDESQRKVPGAGRQHFLTSGGLFHRQHAFFHEVGCFFRKAASLFSTAEGGKFLQLVPIQLEP